MHEHIRPAGTSTWELLKSLGFVEDHTIISDPPPSLLFDFGNFKLSASRLMSRWLQPIVLLSGTMSDGRMIANVQTELPLEMESREQGLAFVAWCLDNAAGREFEPRVETVWLVEGRLHHNLLPWVGDRAAYDARPHCLVERDWARLALKKLASVLVYEDDDSDVGFGFDGKVLMITCETITIAVQAEGPPWVNSYSVKSGLLRRLPRRLRETIEVAIWKSKLSIGGYTYNEALVIENSSSA